MHTFENIHIDVEGRVALLTIDHPPVNALNTATFTDLRAAFEQALADETVKVIVITGAGRCFVAGADVRELYAMSDADDARGKAEEGQRLFDAIERSPKPVIAAVNRRYCLGGGNELALACHIRIAEEGVQFGQPEIKLGLIPGWGATQRLPRLVGVSKAIELILTGETIDAQEAYRLGMVNRVVPSGTVVQEALSLAELLSKRSSLALRKALDAIRTGMETSLEEGLACEAARFGEMADTKDMREGLGAFLEKREPQFTDS